MKTPKTVRVKAAPGRKVPIHSSVARAPGGGQLFVHEDDELELADVSYVRRRIAAGDLVVIEKPAPEAPQFPAPFAPFKETP